MSPHLSLKLTVKTNVTGYHDNIMYGWLAWLASPGVAAWAAWAGGGRAMVKNATVQHCVK